FVNDYPLGRLGAGAHTLKIVVDSDMAIPESDETDNSYTKTITISHRVMPTAGSYNGLFYESSGVYLESSGFFSVTITAKGKFTGKLQLGSGRYSAIGQFDSAGAAHVTLAKGALTLDLQLDPQDP